MEYPPKKWGADMSATNDLTSNQHKDQVGTDKTPSSKVLGGFAAFSGLGAILASSCCVFPLALSAVGASASVISAFHSFESMRLPLLMVAGVSLLGGWYVWWSKRNAEYCSTGYCSTPASRNSAVVMLSISTFIILLGLSWEHIEPVLLQAIKG